MTSLPLHRGEKRNNNNKKTQKKIIIFPSLIKFRYAIFAHSKTTFSLKMNDLFLERLMKALVSSTEPWFFPAAFTQRKTFK